MRWSAPGSSTRDADRRRAVAGELGVCTTSSLQELLEDSDAVVVAVPTLAHETVALQAIQAGIHVFVEKPLARRTWQLRTA